MTADDDVSWITVMSVKLIGRVGQLLALDHKEPA